MIRTAREIAPGLAPPISVALPLQMKPINSNTPLDQLLQAVPVCRSLLVQLGVNPELGLNRSVAEICREYDLDAPTVTRLLLALAKTMAPVPAAPANLMPLSELCDHLEQPQQACLYDELENLDLVTRAAASRDGEANPQFLAIREAFVAFRGQLSAHLLSETVNLFPLIRRLATGDPRERPTRLALESRVARMEREHNQVDEALAELGLLVANGSLQEKFPVVTQTMTAAVVRLERTVHEQIYHENQVLFPRALACECSA